MKLLHFILAAFVAPTVAGSEFVPFRIGHIPKAKWTANLTLAGKGTYSG